MKLNAREDNIVKRKKIAVTQSPETRSKAATKQKSRKTKKPLLKIMYFMYDGIAINHVLWTTKEWTKDCFVSLYLDWKNLYFLDFPFLIRKIVFFCWIQKNNNMYIWIWNVGKTFEGANDDPRTTFFKISMFVRKGRHCRLNNYKNWK